MSAAPARSGLVARGLAARYAGAPAPSLAGVDLDLAAGEVALVTGPSASGKTTLVRVLNGLLPRSFQGSTVEGRAALAGEELIGLSARGRAARVGTLLQEPARQVVGHTVRRELAFGPENLGLPRADVAARVLRVAHELGIEHLLDRAVDELSGGELQKVALGGALATEPSLLLVDEPLAALDPESAREVARLLRGLADRGAIVLAVEHRVEEVLAGARPDRAIAFEGGRARALAVGAFLEQADPRHLRLPADVAVRRWRALGATAGPRPRARVARGSAGAAPLAFEGVVMDRGGRRVIDGVDLELFAGEVLALLGPNGSGKSTLLRLALGLLRPDRGRVLLGGRDLAGRTVAEAARDAALCFQDPASMLFADTVLAECRFAPENLGLDDPEGRARRALERFGLAALAERSPGALSTGQKKRVCLAAIAAQGARAWLYDEPTAGLDPSGAADLLAALDAGRAAGEAVLLATHDLDLALVHADRVCVLARGRVRALGPPGEVLTDRAVLADARLARTSLLEANAPRLARGLPPLDARALAQEPA